MTQHLSGRRTARQALTRMISDHRRKQPIDMEMLHQFEWIMANGAECTETEWDEYMSEEGYMELHESHERYLESWAFGFGVDF